MLPIHVARVVVDDLFDRHVGSSARWSKHWYLHWDRLVEMQSMGHTIGGHGYDHEPYTRLPPAQRRRDINAVAALLRDGLGADIRPFAYPYGSFDDDTCQACQDAGFVHAFSTRRCWIVSGCDLQRIPRVDTIDVGAMLAKESACTPG